jgi:hypothetical protein
MKIREFGCLAALVLLTACSVNRNVPTASAKKYSSNRSPKFMKGVTMSANGCNEMNTTVADGSSYKGGEYKTYKSKPYSRQVAKNSKQQPKSTTIIIQQPIANNHVPRPDTGKIIITPSVGKSIQSKYASTLGVEPVMLSNILLYCFVDDWMGVRYRIGGSDRRGIDCSAFAQKLYEDVFGINLVRTAFEQFNFCRMLCTVDSLKEGDLVFFKIRSKRISHVGIYLANNFFVHASRSGGVMISSLSEPYWSRFFAGAGQVPKNGLTSGL